MNIMSSIRLSVWLQFGINKYAVTSGPNGDDKSGASCKESVVLNAGLESLKHLSEGSVGTL